MRNSKMQDVRREWKPSRFFFGKNRIIAMGLGRTPEEEVEDDLHKVSSMIIVELIDFMLFLQLTACLKGNNGLLFTNCPKKEVIQWFEDFSIEDYARSGFKTNTTVTLPAGPLKQFAHSIEPYLRTKLGMPTKLEKGKLHFTNFCTIPVLMLRFYLQVL